MDKIKQLSKINFNIFSIIFSTNFLIILIFCYKALSKFDFLNNLNKNKSLQPEV